MYKAIALLLLLILFASCEKEYINRSGIKSKFQQLKGEWILKDMSQQTITTNHYGDSSNYYWEYDNTILTRYTAEYTPNNINGTENFDTTYYHINSQLNFKELNQKKELIYYEKYSLIEIGNNQDTTISEGERTLDWSEIDTDQPVFYIGVRCDLFEIIHISENQLSLKYTYTYINQYTNCNSVAYFTYTRMN